MDELEQKYMALVERVRGYPMAEAARAVILAEIDAAYRRERAQRRRTAPSASAVQPRAYRLKGLTGDATESG